MPGRHRHHGHMPAAVAGAATRSAGPDAITGLLRDDPIDAPRFGVSSLASPPFAQGDHGAGLTLDISRTITLDGRDTEDLGPNHFQLHP